MTDSNIAVLNTPKWSPKQALTAAAAQMPDDSEVCFVVYKHGAFWHSITSSADTGDFLVAAEALRRRALRGWYTGNADSDD